MGPSRSCLNGRTSALQLERDERYYTKVVIGERKDRDRDGEKEREREDIDLIV